MVWVLEVARNFFDTFFSNEILKRVILRVQELFLVKLRPLISPISVKII